jgi:hypothetical protein
MKRECKELPNGDLSCSDAGKAAADRGSTASTLSTVGFGVGLVGVGVGTVLLLTARSDDSRRSAWVVAPLLAGDTGGAVFRSRF